MDAGGELDPQAGEIGAAAGLVLLDEEGVFDEIGREADGGEEAGEHFPAAGGQQQADAAGVGAAEIAAKPEAEGEQVDEVVGVHVGDDDGVDAAIGHAGEQRGGDAGSAVEQDARPARFDEVAGTCAACGRAGGPRAQNGQPHGAPTGLAAGRAALAGGCDNRVKCRSKNGYGTGAAP